MIPTPDLSTLSRLNEEAKQFFLASNFADALRVYDEALEKTFEENPTTLSALQQLAKDTLGGGGNNGGGGGEGGGDDGDNVLRAALLSAFILRLKPFYFDATTTYVAAITATNGADGVKTARILLKHHLAKDGTDEDAKKLSDSLSDTAESDVATSTSAISVSASRTPAALGVVHLSADLATAVGNNLNNSSLCELKLKRFEAAAASAAQALLFLDKPDARAKALFRHAQALARGGNAEAEAAVKKAEEHLKKAEVKLLRGILAEAKGRHDWTTLLKECLKDEKKVVDATEYLSPKIGLGNSPTKGLGLVATDDLKKGEMLCVQQAVHFVGPRAASESDEHLDFPKTLLMKVLKDPRNEVALRILGQKGEQMTEADKMPPIEQAFRRLPTRLPFLRDQLAATQIREEVKIRGGREIPLMAYEGTPEHDSESRRLASLITEVVKKLSRQSTSLALSFDVRYKKTMTQTGGEPELGQLGIWTIPALLHHAEFPNVTFGTMGGVSIVTAIRDVAKGTPLAAMMGGIQCLPERLRHLKTLGISYSEDCDPDHPLTAGEAEVVATAAAAFQRANDLKMETVGKDPGEAKPLFEKAIDVCLDCVREEGKALERADPLGLAAIYFTLADCLGGKKDLSGMVKAYYMGIQSAHRAIVVNLDTLTRMTKMQKFIPMAKKLEEMQDQAEMVAKNNPSLQEEFKKIAKIKNIGPTIGTIQEFLEENLTKGCKLLFSTSEAFKLLS